MPLFITIAALFVLVIIFAIFYPVISLKYCKKNYKKIYGRKIFRIAKRKCCYLLNNLLLQSNDDAKVSIDHILFGNKFIYVFEDYYHYGSLSAKAGDASWIFSPYKSKQPRCYIDNPVLLAEARREKIAQLIGQDPNIVVSVVLINSDADISNYEQQSKNVYLMKVNKLNKFIKNMESMNVAPLNQKAMCFAVKDINNLNLNKNEHNS